MNKYTVTCAVLVFFLALGGVYFAGKLATKRNAITEQIVAEKKKRDDNIKQIAELKITRLREAEELSRLQSEWGRQWTAKGQFDPMLGAVLLNVGMGKARPDDVCHVFSVDPNGESRYMGEFKVAEPGAQQTILALNHKPDAEELATWPQGQVDLRVRDRIPPGIRGTFHDFATKQAIADQIVINETAKDQIQQNHIEASNKTHNQRILELEGDESKPQTADPEIVYGLVKTLRTEEAARNAVLKDVDALRRQLSDLYARLVRILAENKQAVDSLAAGTETAATPARAAN